MKKITLIAFVILSCLSCKNNSEENLKKENRESLSEAKFDSHKWSIKQGAEYPYRDKMLNDLVYRVKLKGFKKERVLKLLGDPDRIDNNYLFYTIDKTSIMFFTLHVKTLVIKLAPDQTVAWRKIKE